MQTKHQKPTRFGAHKERPTRLKIRTRFKRFILQFALEIDDCPVGSRPAASLAVFVYACCLAHWLIGTTGGREAAKITADGFQPSGRREGGQGVISQVGKSRLVFAGVAECNG